MTIEIRSLSSENVWDAENAFYWFSHPARISKLLSHFELYKLIIDLPGDFVEFGVYKSASLIRFATFRKILENDFSRKIVGFDAFGKFPHNSGNTSTDSKFIEKFTEHCLEHKIPFSLTGFLAYDWSFYENYRFKCYKWKIKPNKKPKPPKGFRFF